ncbi:polysaccharide deacetylase family protein [Senegalia massiliensis]|uniref:polysaccharide deacetylase family protein n=1 Tax=Senegalia massiliensis TaxID=1720316 RepID=UPI001362CB17
MSRKKRFIRFIFLCIISIVIIIILIGNHKSVSYSGKKIDVQNNDKNNLNENSNQNSIEVEQDYNETDLSTDNREDDIDNDTENDTEDDIDTVLTVPVEEAYKKDDRKIAFLTFDDGPSKNTTEILKILDEENIKATFFVLGKLAKYNDETIKDIYNKNHKIGNHTYSHEYRKIYSSTDILLNEVNKTNEILKGILGDDFKSNLFRFPGGSFGENKSVYRQAIKNQGYKYVDWNALNKDSEGRNKTPNELLLNIKETTKNKKRVIILMHDSATKKNTVESLPMVIDYLKNEGYEFGVLD